MTSNADEFAAEAIEGRTAVVALTEHQIAVLRVAIADYAHKMIRQHERSHAQDATEILAVLDFAAVAVR